jgi:hypothetical protein
VVAQQRALLVVDAVPLATDPGLEAHLRGLGLTVDVIAQDAATASSANDRNLVVISVSADSATLADAFRQSPVPVIVLEATVANAMKLGQLANPVSEASVDVVEGAHPITSGLPASVTLCTGKQLSDGTAVAPPGLSLAEVTGSPGASALFVFEAGDVVEGQALPARRVGLNVLRGLNCQTEEAFDLLTRAVRWVLSA